jgi:hypothetical protein
MMHGAAEQQQKAKQETHEGDTKQRRRASSINNLTTISCSKYKKMTNSNTMGGHDMKPAHCVVSAICNQVFHMRTLDVLREKQ